MAASQGAHSVVIADDHALVRSALRQILQSIDGVEIVGEAANGLEAIALAKAKRPALLTLDVAMPLARGMEVFGEARRWSPDSKIAVVTGFTAVGALADWISAGVDGLFLKSCPPDEMRHGFELLLAGGGYYSKAVLKALQGKPGTADLTQRERQILHLIAEGCSNGDIAHRLSISPKTVDNHRTHLMAKLNVHSIAQLLALALKEGLLDQSRQL